MEVNEEQKDLLHKLYYDEKRYFGRDKLFQYVQLTFPDSGISRRMIMSFLKEQSIWQKTAPPPVRQKISSIAVDQPDAYFQCDLAGPLPRDNGYNYYFACTDVATRRLFTRPLKGKPS